MVSKDILLALLPVVLAAQENWNDNNLETTTSPVSSQTLPVTRLTSSATTLDSTVTSSPADAPESVFDTDQTNASSPLDNQSLLQYVKNSNSNAQRISTLLTHGGGSDAFKFDFANPPAYSTISGSFGRIVSTTGTNFPATWGQGVSTSQAVLESCSVSIPHSWSRATELVLVQDGQLALQFFSEPGTAPVNLTLTANQVAVIPQGSLRYFWNPTCLPTTYYTFLNNDDPGMALAAPSLLALSDDEDSLERISMGTFEDQISVLQNIVGQDTVESITQCVSTCGPEN